MRLIILFSLTLMSFTATTTSAIDNKAYKWTDSKGITHYTAYKPADGISFTVVDAPPPPPSDASDPDAGDTAETRAADKGKSGVGTKDLNADNDDEFNAEQCKIAKNNLTVLRGKARVTYKDNEGNIAYLEEDEKEAKIAEAEKHIKFYCE